MGDDPTPRQCLERISQGLRQIGLRRRHMALVAARFSADGRRVVLSAAAMPPVLLYRAGVQGPGGSGGSGGTEAQVASIEFQSLPLGSLASDRYEEKVLDQEVGDRLVFLSDGLPEARDETGRPVGYPRVEEAVLENGDLSPKELIAELLSLVRRDEGARPDDDLTLVAVAVAVAVEALPSRRSRPSPETPAS